MNYVLAIDQSTSATKALLFTSAGDLLDKTSVSHQQIYPSPGWVEHDAASIYANTLQAINLLLDRNKQLVPELLCVSVTNQRETFVVFDIHTGEPLHNAIVWQCRRGESICSDLSDAGHAELVQQRTGLKLDTYFPAPKLKWLLDTRPDIRQKLEAGEALFGTIDTYLIFRLTRGQTFATDQTNASRTLLFNIHDFSWDAELCRLFGVLPQALAEVRDSSGYFGETTLGGILPQSLPICGVMGDSQAALFAQRGFEPGAAKVTFGTGSSVLLNIGDHVALSSHGIVTAVAWVRDGQPTYAFEGIINFTGATIVWLRDQLKLIESVEETEALATAVSDSGGVYLVPAFVGLGAPYWQPNAQAAILGLTPSSTKNHIVRASLESIAYCVRDVTGVMVKDAGVTLQVVYADGGAVGNKLLMQIVADLTQVTVRASSLPELSAFGAALAGLLGMGIYRSLEELAALPQRFVDYQPSMTRQRADRYYTGWQRAVQQVLSGASSTTVNPRELEDEEA